MPPLAYAAKGKCMANMLWSPLHQQSLLLLTSPINNSPDVLCTECSCDPAGAQEVPGYPLGGCGAYSDGQLCECKQHVAGRICDTCQAGYWNLQIHNPHGCQGLYATPPSLSLSLSRPH